MMTIIVRCDSSFFAKVKSKLNFRIALEKDHGVSILADLTLDIVEDMVSLYFLTGNSY